MSTGDSIRFLVTEEPTYMPVREWEPSFPRQDVTYEEEEPVREFDNRLIRVTELRQIGASSILIKWTKLNSQKVDGYEIIVNGRVKGRVLSGTRTSSVVDSVNLIDSYILIFAICNNQRCTPPASAKFKMICTF